MTRGGGNALAFAAVALSVVLWSTAYVISELVLDTASPAVFSVGRFALAVPVLGLLVAVRGSDPRRAGLLSTLWRPRTLLLGLTGVTLYYLPTNIALEITTAGTAALLAAALPVLTSVLAVFVLREHLPPRTIVGLVFATVGVVVVVAEGFTIDLGIVLALVGVLSYAVYTVLLRLYSQPPVGIGPTPDTGAITLPSLENPVEPRPARTAPDPLTLATATGIWGTAFMLPWLAIEVAAGAARMPTGAIGWSGLLLLAFVVTAPTLVLFNYGAERIPASISGIAIAGIPVLGYASAVVLGEPFVAVKAIGGIIALAGIVIATLPSGPARRRPRAPLSGDLRTESAPRRALTRSRARRR
ncbi:DMT family transporter [uncultured Schumannella sp.]|uniref:DMT family transporter n=1 Tax=uncultured Schumannella sp. TaxID=1195956 RepID=UPI0025F7B23D|nr:DMT family transporter [uncultured Schumannella sp.]